MEHHGTAEHYAEKMEFRWLREVVLPYLERDYSSSVNELLAWVQLQGGAKVSLDFFAGENRHTGRNGVTRAVTSTACAFELWVEELVDCRTSTDSRFAFATQSYFANHYELCVQVLDAILGTEPRHEDALIWKAHALRQLKRHDEGLAIVDELLAREPGNARAHEGRGELLCGKKAWLALLENCDRWEACLATTTTEAHFEALRHRAIACCALGHQTALDELIERLVNFEGRKPKRDFLVKWIHREAGQMLPPGLIKPAPKRVRIR